MKYHIEIEVHDSLIYTIDAAVSLEHAGDLAIQMFKQDYPDLNFSIVSCEEEDD